MNNVQMKGMHLKKRNLCNIKCVFTVNFEQFDASLVEVLILIKLYIFVLTPNFRTVLYMTFELHNTSL